MAKKRMGRNLNALLGGAARDRANSQTSDQPGNSGSPASAEPEETINDASTSQPENTPPGNHSSAKPGRHTSGTEDSKSSSTNTSETTAKSNQPGSDPVTDGSIDSASGSKTSSASTKTAVTSAGGDTTSDMPDYSAGTGEQLIMLGVEKIRRGTYQPRRLFDQELLQELADSIKEQGMIQPIIVRPFADGYELVAGERRWRASQLAGIDRIPAIVRQMEDRSVAAVSVIENIQRKDLNPLEEASAFERLCDEFGMTHKAVAEAIGRSRASVTNLMRLLELHDEVKVLVDKGELEMGHARALLGAPRDRQPEIARRIVKQTMTVRAVESYIRSLDADGNEPPDTPSQVTDPDIERLSQKLGDKLGAKVQITHKGNGAGKLQISYSSVSELQGILAHIK